MLKARQLLIISLIFITTLACSTKQPIVEKAVDSKILHRGNYGEPQTLDPNIATGVPESNILFALFEGLIDRHPKGLEPIPGVAKSWTISDDKLVYTFKLRPDAKWSNGDKVTAKDFVYSWKRTLTPKLASEFAYMLYYLKNAEAYNTGKTTDFKSVGAKALDDNTLQVTLENPTSYFLLVLQHHTTYPVHQKTIEAHGGMADRNNTWTKAENIVSNGPFKIKSWAMNQKIVLDKNPFYWDTKKIKLNEVHFYPIDNLQTEERKFRAGELHITKEIPQDKIASYKKNKDKADFLKIDSYLGSYYYQFNTKKAPFDNVLVRKAFAMTIDRDSIVKYVTKGGQKSHGALTPPETAGYTPKANIPYDVKAAQDLFAKAGYPNGKGFPAVTVLYNTQDNHRKIAEAIQQMWKKALNVQVDLVNQDWKVYLDSLTNLNYDIVRRGWVGDYNDPYTFLEIYMTENGNNKSGWGSPEYDTLMAKSLMLTDKKERYKILQKAETLLLEATPILPIYAYTRVYLKSPLLKGWYPNTMDYHNYKHLYLEK